jgi:hypothetical protein
MATARTTVAIVYVTQVRQNIVEQSVERRLLTNVLSWLDWNAQQTHNEIQDNVNASTTIVAFDLSMLFVGIEDIDNNQRTTSRMSDETKKKKKKKKQIERRARSKEEIHIDCWHRSRRTLCSIGARMFNLVRRDSFIIVCLNSANECLTIQSILSTWDVKTSWSDGATARYDQWNKREMCTASFVRKCMLIFVLDQIYEDIRWIRIQNGSK